MIYYNLESAYAGDVTKHCGLTIDEVDNNFYELETSINNLKNSGIFNQKRLWAFSNMENFPNMNSVTTETLSDGSCLISGTVKDGAIILGIDSANLYGLSVWFDGSLVINGIHINPKYYRYNNLSIPLYIHLCENGTSGEYIATITGEDQKDTVSVTTNNKTLSFYVEYENERLVEGSFIFSNDIVLDGGANNV